MFTEEQQAAIDKQLKEQKEALEAQFSESISGLKSTNAALKAEKQEAIDKAKADALELEQKAIDAAKEAGEFQKALELERAQNERKLGEYAEQLNSRNDMILSSKNSAAVKDMVSKFVKQDKLSQLTADQLVTHSFDENGDVKAEYKNLDGEVVSDTFDGWLAAAQKDPDMQQYLAGSKSSGVDSGKIKPTGSQSNPDQRATNWY